MKTYNTMFEALIEADKSCHEWESPRSPGVVYNTAELSEITTVYDMTYPLKDMTKQYAAFPDGEICLINFQTRLVTVLFMPHKAEESETTQLQTEMPEAAQQQASEQAAKRKWNFCPNCGAKISENAHFCEECGTKID